MLISNVPLSSFKLAALLLALATLSGGCALVPIDRNRVATYAPEYADCLATYEENDALIKHAGVRDVQATQVRGFPFLRTNRFLSSLRDQLDTVIEQETWLAYLAQLDAEVDRLKPRIPRQVSGRPSRRSMTWSAAETC